MSGEQLVDAASLSSASLLHEAWRTGHLRWKLDPHQQLVYDKIKMWEADPPDSAAIGALFDSVYVVDIGRRWGKTAMCLIILYEWAIRTSGLVLTYATAEKQQIKSIVIPLHRKLSNDAPEDVRPEYKGSSEGMEQGLYFPNSSMIKLVGVDKDPDRLRGQGSDGGVFSEAGHMKDLEESVSGIFLPQFQRRPWARLILESTAPTQPDHDFDRVFVPDAELRGAYVFGTIEDNLAITPEDRAKYIREAGGRNSPRCLREYYGIRVRDPERVLVPEFNEDKHVVPNPGSPDYAHCYVGVDPGTRDKIGVVWAFWDFERAKLVVQRSYAERNVTTTPVADLLKRTERELWYNYGPQNDNGSVNLKSTRYWNGRQLVPNPYLRVSDTDLRLIGDLVHEHGIAIAPTPKDDAEAQLYALRNAFLANKIEVVADSGPLAVQLKRGMWNDTRTDWDRSDELGHLDCVAALIYLWRNVVRTLNPFPPAMPKGNADTYLILPWHQKSEKDTVRALSTVFGQGKQRTRWR
jgi:hypothetical protein